MIVDSTKTEEEIIEVEQERLIPVVLNFIWSTWGMDRDEVFGNLRDGRPTSDHLREAMKDGIRYEFGKQ